MAAAESSSSFFGLKNNRPPDDTVFYSIYPDSSVGAAAAVVVADELQSLHLRILNHISPIVSPYIWQHQSFTLSIASAPIPHLSGHLRFGDNLEDEWFVVYILFEISKAFPDLSVRVWDSDGEFLLIETAYHLPKWLKPETSDNRVFIRRGLLHIIQQSSFPVNPTLMDSLKFLVSNTDDSATRAADAVQLQLRKKLDEYPDRAYRNIHRARVIVPVSVAWVLKHEPCLISLAVEGFYDRDIDSMKYASKMEKFLPKGKQEAMVEVVVRMSRAMYAQLVQQKFQAPSCFPMPDRSNIGKYLEAELGMKITCGFEMMYQMRKKQGDEGKGSTWEAFNQSLENCGYFEGLLPGSKEYKRLMEKAEGYYRNSMLHHRASEVLSAPVKQIDEILALPHSADDFTNQDLPPSDNDSWLYGGEDELHAALLEREKEMGSHNMKQKKKKKPKEHGEEDSTSGGGFDEHDLGGIAQSMQEFVKRMSSYEGAEVAQDRDLKDVDIDVDQFMKDMEMAMGHRHTRGENDSDDELADGLSSDLDFADQLSDDYEDDSEHSENMEEDKDEFMNTYSDALSRELKDTTLSKTFVRTNDQPPKNNGNAGASDGMDELGPVDIDFNLVKNFLDSYSSQEGQSGPASNLLGLMGLRLPYDAGKDKGKGK
ncbi:protein ecdysoneless homolog isoform X2 [Andrographis paniculata]|uniref:protein ecdysoneless homolog isoform X2 n=1 Tax=Andrographis paniculata TaxID=175694 RepID=UPI0021E7573D|nr:protein ecdysoneless homolog isoform X2 [Andrographis paniculata]